MPIRRTLPLSGSTLPVIDDDLATLPSPLRRALLRLPPAFGLLGLWGLSGIQQAQGAARPPLMLANTYHQGVSLADYWVSEKYDGIRAYWDGAALWTRSGEAIRAPAWFTQGWPASAMDGELWAGRGRFEETMSAVRQQRPVEQAWRAVSFMAFDLPGDAGVFDQRLPALQALAGSLHQPWVMAVPQHKIDDHAALQRLLADVERQGGEGLVLHRGAARYTAGRSDDLLKFKSSEDAEAKVVGYLAGKGKHEGRVGALVVETPQGMRFGIGSGLSDAQRRDPPPLGSIVTYRYRGLHASGKPRFAVLLRPRLD